MPTAVVALALLAAHFPAKPAALAGSAELPETYRGPAIPALTSYNFKNYDPANREFFRTAFASGVVTLTDRFPEDSKPWSPWFLARMRDGNQILTYAEIARFKEAVALFVYHDTRLLWRPNWQPSAFVKALDEVLTDAFKAVKISEPSNEMIQVGMAEAVCQWVQTKQNYRDNIGSGGGKLIANLLKNDPDSSWRFVCENASHLSYLAVGHWEKFRNKAGRGTGIIAMGLRGLMWGGNGKAGPHAWFGVSIKCADGRRMKIQLDSVPGRRSTPNRRIATQHMGCFSRVGCETVAATRLLQHVSYDDLELETGPKDRLAKYHRASTQQGIQIDDPFVQPDEHFYFGMPIRYEPQEPVTTISKRILRAIDDSTENYSRELRPMYSGHVAAFGYYNRFPF